MKGPSVAIPGKALLNMLHSLSLESLGLGARAGDWGGVVLGTADRFLWQFSVHGSGTEGALSLTGAALLSTELWIARAGRDL